MALRNLVNSLLGGQLIALFLTQAVFVLNSHIPLDSMTLLRVWGAMALTYGLVVGLVLWLVLVLFEELHGSAIRPAWLSFRLLTWLLILDLAAAATLLWHNLFYYRLYLPPDTIHSVASSATTLSAAAAVLLVLGLFHYSFGRRAALFGYALVFTTMGVSLALPFALRPNRAVESPAVPRLPLADSPAPRRLTIIGIEGASMSYVLPAIAEGKLPNFARLIEGGASGALRTLQPTESLAVWTSMATGKLPRQHGLHGFYRYLFFGEQPPFSLLPHGIYFRGLEHTGMIQRSAVTSSQRKTETFWGILTSFGVQVGLLRWWGTYPAEAIDDGFIVSELFHRQIWEQFDPPLPHLTYPEELAEQLAPYVVRPDDVESQELDRYVDLSVQMAGDTLPWEAVLRSSLAEDATYHRLGRLLKESHDPEVYALYLFGLDRVGHTFYRFHRPESFGNVSDSELTKYGRVIEAYYGYLDTILGEYIQSQRPEEILVVLSGHGMEPLPVTRRIVETFKGGSYLTGYHDDGPDGLALFYGPGIAQGAKFQGSVVDITPTLLYLMGLPLGQDMDGTLLADILEESLSRGQPVTFISSYRNFLIEPRKDEPIFDLPSPLDALREVLDPRN